LFLLVLQRAPLVVRSGRAEGLAVRYLPPARRGQTRRNRGGADVTANNDPPDLTPEESAAAIERMERLSRHSAADAVWMQQEAAEKRSRADYQASQGDRVGPQFELAEAASLERDAADILHPLTHTTAPVEICRGGELATNAAMMQPYIDIVRTYPDWLVHTASRDRMRLATNAGALEMGLDASATINAANSLEKMLAHEMAAAHSLGMRMIAAAGEELAAYANSGHKYPHRSIEAARMANTAARLMDTYQRGMLTLDRIRNGGRQNVVVQHVNVETGAQAVVAGTIDKREPGGTRE
jgi:hypothetical protein